MKKSPKATDSTARPTIGKVTIHNPDYKAPAARGPERIQVSAYLTPEQYAIFAPAAENSKATVGEVLLALACDYLCYNPCADDPVEQLESALWSYSTGRFIPNVEKRWGEAKFLVSQPAEVAQ